tara:strand:+ start:294 stop:569 length:276 start_codon:yes stop_codon:yes gene_type:complete
MAKRRSNRIYSDNDITVMLKLPKALHQTVLADAKSEFRSLPMHIISILNKRYNGVKEEPRGTTRSNNLLYTEQELKDMQTKYNERENNGRI